MPGVHTADKKFLGRTAPALALASFAISVFYFDAPSFINGECERESFPCEVRRSEQPGFYPKEGAGLSWLFELGCVALFFVPVSLIWHRLLNPLLLCHLRLFIPRFLSFSVVLYFLLWDNLGNVNAAIGSLLNETGGEKLQTGYSRIRYSHWVVGWGLGLRWQGRESLTELMGMYSVGHQLWYTLWSCVGGICLVSSILGEERSGESDSDSLVSSILGERSSGESDSDSLVSSILGEESSGESDSDMEQGDGMPDDTDTLQRVVRFLFSLIIGLIFLTAGVISLAAMVKTVGQRVLFIEKSNKLGWTGTDTHLAFGPSTFIFVVLATTMEGTAFVYFCSQMVVHSYNAVIRKRFPCVLPWLSRQDYCHFWTVESEVAIVFGAGTLLSLWLDTCIPILVVCYTPEVWKLYVAIWRQRPFLVLFLAAAFLANLQIHPFDGTVMGHSSAFLVFTLLYITPVIRPPAFLVELKCRLFQHTASRHQHTKGLSHFLRLGLESLSILLCFLVMTRNSDGAWFVHIMLICSLILILIAIVTNAKVKSQLGTPQKILTIMVVFGFVYLVFMDHGPPQASRTSGRYAVCGKVWDIGGKPHDIVDMAHFAHSAYRVQDSQNVSKAELIGFKRSKSTPEFVHYIYSDTHVLSIRGVSDSHDWVQNFMFLGDTAILQWLPFAGPLSTEAFGKVIEKITNRIQYSEELVYMDTLREYIKVERINDKTDKRWIFVGHSLGGYLAQLCALTFNNSIAVTFSSPGIHLSRHKHSLSNELKRGGLNVYSQSDPVSQIDLHHGMVQNIECHAHFTDTVRNCHSIETTEQELSASCNHDTTANQGQNRERGVIQRSSRESVA